MKTKYPLARNLFKYAGILSYDDRGLGSPLRRFTVLDLSVHAFNQLLSLSRFLPETCPTYTILNPGGVFQRCFTLYRSEMILDTVVSIRQQLRSRTASNHLPNGDRL